MNPLYDIDLSDIDAITTQLYGLINECTLGGNPPDCQFHELRKLSFSERISFINQISDSVKVDYYVKHKACFARKSGINI